MYEAIRTSSFVYQYVICILAFKNGKIHDFESAVVHMLCGDSIIWTTGGFQNLKKFQLLKAGGYVKTIVRKNYLELGYPKENFRPDFVTKMFI